MAKRADNVGETRQRIVEAAMELHGSIGPAATTIAGIAERADVTRLTVYRHFPDEEALFEACSSHWVSLQQLPDPAAWAQVGDPIERLRVALADLYRFYRDAEGMLTMIYRDVALAPAGPLRAIAERNPAMRATAERNATMRALLLDGLPELPQVRAAVGHAMSFTAWKSLCREQGLSNHDAAELMVALVAVTSRSH